MKKIGIVTLYYKNYNYGGLLQAYAMQKVTSDMGYNSKLISYSKGKYLYFFKRLIKLNFFFTIKNVYNRIRYSLKMRDNSFKKNIDNRINKFEEFIDFIPHTQVYDEKTIGMCQEDFDCFICGSDQIWNPGWWTSSYFLSFVDGNKKKKIAYAASIGRSSLSNSEKKYMRDNLKDFHMISVRESNAKPLLMSFINKDVEFVLDPTLLVERQQWKSLAREVKITEPYAFVYMVGNEKKYKKNICEICKSLNVKMVTLPNTKFTYDESDEKYGDIKLYEVGPREWLYLMENSKYVFTDSFHGMVFSTIFEKNFWGFEREKEGHDSTNSRIYSLLKLLGLQDRLINPEMFLSPEKFRNSIDFVIINDKVKHLKEESIKIFANSLK